MMAILRFLWSFGVSLVTAFGAWWVWSEAIIPLFENTVHHEIRVTGVTPSHRWGFRTVTTCYDVYPATLFASVYSCDPMFDGIKRGAVVVIELDHVALQKAREATARIKRNEIHQVCTGGPVYTPVTCFDSRPSEWRNPTQKYNYAFIKARAAGNRDAPPELGDWKVEIGSVGIFVIVGFLFIGGATIRMGAQWSRGGVEHSDEKTAFPPCGEVVDIAGDHDITPLQPPLVPETKTFDAEPRAFGKRGAFEGGKGTWRNSSNLFEAAAPRGIEEFGETAPNQAEIDTTEPEPVLQPDALAKLIARMWVEGLEEDADRLWDKVKNFPSGNLEKRRLVACDIDGLLRTSLENCRAPAEAKTVPRSMIEAAWEETVFLATRQAPGDPLLPPPLEKTCPGFSPAKLPNTAKLLNILRDSRLDDWYLKLAKAAEDLSNRRHSKAAAETIRNDCDIRLLGEVPVLLAGRSEDDFRWLNFLASVMSEIDPYAK